MIRGAAHQQICRDIGKCVCGLDEFYRAWKEGHALLVEQDVHHDMVLLRMVIQRSLESEDMQESA